MFCGLEAVVTTPTGRSEVLYVADAFATEWIHTPASIDVVKSFFRPLFGSSTDNKDDVVKNASWKFTGRRNMQYANRGAGDP